MQPTTKTQWLMQFKADVDRMVYEQRWRYDDALNVVWSIYREMRAPLV